MKKRPLTFLWVIYAILVLYGSLMPFDFEFSASLFKDNLQRAFTFWPFGPTFPGKADLVSNLLLYIPLGLLVASAGRVNRNDRPAWCITNAVAIGALVSLCVESFQAFSSTRVAGVHDFAVNTLGAFCGGIMGASYGKEMFRFLIIRTRRYWRHNPTALLAGIMGFFITFDAWFPFLPTLKLKELSSNYHNSIMSVSTGLEVHSSSYWIIKKVGVFAILSMLLVRAFHKFGQKRFMMALITTAVFALACESGKIFISNRFFNAANVATAITGAFAGLLLASMFAKRVSLSGKILLSAIALIIYIIYIQLEGQSFDFTSNNIADKLPRGVEWLPMYDYTMSGRGGKIILFIRTVGLTAALTFALQLLRHGWEYKYRPSLLKWGFIMAVFGVILEGMQFFIPERYPTLTDVFCFVLGGFVGCILTMLSPMIIDRKKKPKEKSDDISDKLLYLKYTR